MSSNNHVIINAKNKYFDQYMVHQIFQYNIHLTFILLTYLLKQNYVLF